MVRPFWYYNIDFFQIYFSFSQWFRRRTTTPLGWNLSTIQLTRCELFVIYLPLQRAFLRVNILKLQCRIFLSKNLQFFCIPWVKIDYFSITACQRTYCEGKRKPAGEGQQNCWRGRHGRLLKYIIEIFKQKGKWTSFCILIYRILMTHGHSNYYVVRLMKYSTVS